jgi:hypothetical protein
MGLQVTDKYCEHILESVVNVSGTVIMWDVAAVTDRTILANRPYIVKDKRKQSHYRPGVAQRVPGS